MVFRRVEVRRAIDGDTLAVLLPGRSAETVVRLLGIDAPEVSTTRNGAPECGGEQAAHAAQALADLWDTVTVRLDSTQSRYDRYGRLLAYVIPNAEPETTYQQQLLRQGLAETFSYGSFKRRWGFLAARDSARDADVGVFSLCGGDFHQPLLPRAADIAGPAGDKTLVVTSEGFQRAGSWTPTLDGRTLAALSRRFGAPATYSDCIAEWPELGISAGTTYTPGKCKRSASTGQVKFLTATGAGWRTNRGLGVNDDIDRLDALYPNPPESPFWDDDTDQGYAPLQGYFLGGSDGPLKADLVAIVDADSELVTELGATLIFGAG